MEKIIDEVKGRERVLHWKYSNEEDSFDAVDDSLVEELMLKNCSEMFEIEPEEAVDTVFVLNRK